MLVGDKVSYDACNEAYCLLTSYLREDGKIRSNYNTEVLTEFTTFLAEIIKNPNNFNNTEKQS